MPSPRAVLADITNFKLDPKKEYKLGKKHLNANSDQGKKEIVKDKEKADETTLKVVIQPDTVSPVSSADVVVEKTVDLVAELNVDNDLVESENKDVVIESPVEETPTVTQSPETETKIFQNYKKRAKKN